MSHPLFLSFVKTNLFWSSNTKPKAPIMSLDSIFGNSSDKQEVIFSGGSFL